MSALYRVGDRVKIAHKVEQTDLWDDAWVEAMDYTLGTTGKVIGFIDGGVQVQLDDLALGYWSYANESVELVESAA